jgi:hypothetical protein
MHKLTLPLSSFICIMAIGAALKFAAQVANVAAVCFLFMIPIMPLLANVANLDAILPLVESSQTNDDAKLGNPTVGSRERRATSSTNLASNTNNLSQAIECSKSHKSADDFCVRKRRTQGIKSLIYVKIRNTNTNDKNYVPDKGKKNKKI